MSCSSSAAWPSISTTWRRTRGPRSSSHRRSTTAHALAKPRVTLVGRAEVVEDRDAFAEAYAALHPDARGYIDFPDFQFYRLHVERVRYIAGFGQMGWIKGEAYRAADSGVKQKYFIDSHKAVTPLAILAMMAIYGQWDNPTAWVYLGLHGSYGILWVLKSRIFGDRQWEQPTGWGYGLVIWAGLTLYWIAPWLITSRDVHAPPWLLGLSVFVYAVGVFLHFAADMQKHTALALRPGQLITTGLFARTRNPNYLGELLIYLSLRRPGAALGAAASLWPVPRPSCGSPTCGARIVRWRAIRRLRPTGTARYMLIPRLGGRRRGHSWTNTGDRIE